MSRLRTSALAIALSATTLAGIAAQPAMAAAQEIGDETSIAELRDRAISDPHAEWQLAMEYLSGTRVPKDEQEAFRLVKSASDRGSSAAMISRAVMLATGEGVKENDIDARIWYQKAIDANDGYVFHALRGLGGMFLTGEGGNVDITLGLAMLMIAEAGGDEIAPKILDLHSADISEEDWDAAAAKAEELLNELKADGAGEA